MQRAELAARLVDAGNAEREALLRNNSALGDVELAYILKDICLDAWSSQPPRALAAAETLRLLFRFNNHPEIEALSAWSAGLEALVRGQMELAIENLDQSHGLFLALEKHHEATATRVSKLIALALLGRYDEAIACGMHARELFLAFDDQLAAGKIEHNIGNLHFRRDRYHEAEEFQSSARERFAALKDQKQLATINNCLANTHALLHKFKSAEELFQQALQQAETVKLPVTIAEIEGNIGSFALLQGRYDRALDYLERSRRRYTALGMPHQSAAAELEIADAYLELNLAAEATVIYKRVVPKFAELGMRAEQARALAQQGRAEIALGRTAAAGKLLNEARQLYEAEGNPVGAAMASLLSAQIDYNEGRYEQAHKAASGCESALLNSGSWRKLLQTRWLIGEIDRAQGHSDEARTTLEHTLQEAREHKQPRVAERCLTSLGLLAVSNGEFTAAERSFQSAVALTEELRAPLPGEEFRAAFFADKLTPYNELIRLRLAGGSHDGLDNTAEALRYVERARSRALVEVMGGAVPLQTKPRDTFEAALVAELESVRRELNYLYNQTNRSGTQKLTRQHVEEEILKREQTAAEILRQLAHRPEVSLGEIESLDLPALQRDLGGDTALIEYFTLDDELLAFVVTNDGIEVVRELCNEAQLSVELQQLRFQIDTLRHGSAAIRRHLSELNKRAQHHLQSLYDLLLRPIEETIGERRLVIVPHHQLHYLPFQALHNGEDYLIERREVSYAPSAIVLQQCLRKETRSLRRAVLIGVADELTPRVHEEIETLAPLFSETVVLKDGEATVAALRHHATSTDVLHLACHGQFRPDNPLFSSLRLGDEWLTVRDAYSLGLQSALVTLSACETGVSAVSPGDELIGLARGFFAAGAPTLVISLWTVDDEATTRLMSDFYSALQETRSPATALRTAQMRLLKERPHIFFWSPFIVVGRW
jgi:CHAT domain-containing protein